MTHDHSALITQLDALKGVDPASVFAELIRAGLQALIDAEATDVLGAGRYEDSVPQNRLRHSMAEADSPCELLYGKQRPRFAVSSRATSFL